MNKGGKMSESGGTHDQDQFRWKQFNGLWKETQFTFKRLQVTDRQRNQHCKELQMYIFQLAVRRTTQVFDC